jgi:hypothetical protein
MKKVLAVLIPVALCAAAAVAHDRDDSIVRWQHVSGVITAPGVDNPVAGIRAGAGPWSAHSGSAQVDLATGFAFFEVDGLVLNGSNSSGTPGPVSAVTGTLVCNPGTPSQAILDTPSVALNVRGDAHFSGQIAGIPASCANPLFLVRIAAPAGAAGRWIATATERSIGDEGR